MGLRSGHPFGLVKNGILATFPSLKQDLVCDVAIIGAGITGALITQVLMQETQQVTTLSRISPAHPARP